MKRMVLALALGILGIALAQSPPGLGQALTLEQSLALLQLSPGWKAADLAVLAAQRNLNLALSAAGLNAFAGAEQTFGRDTGGMSARATQLSATLSLNVLPWSGAQDNIRAAERAFERAIWQREETRSSLGLNLVERYFGVRTAGLDVELAEGFRALAERRLQIVQSQAALGQVRQDSILNAQLSLQEALTKERQARSGLELSRRGLSTLVGQPIEGVELTSPPAEAKTPETLQTLLERVLQRRPDLLRATSSLRDAEDSLDIAQRDRWLPEASLQTAYGEYNPAGTQSGPQIAGNLNFKSGELSLSASVPAFVSPSPSDPNNPNTNRLSLRLSLNVPLAVPTGDARIAASSASLEAAQSSLDLTRQQAQLEVRQRYAELGDAQAQLSQVLASLKAAQERLNIAQARLEGGLGTVVEVEAATLGVRQAEREVLTIRVNIYLSALRLEVAAGGSAFGGNP